MPAIQSINANLSKFLDLIAFSEGTSTSLVTKDNGYDVVVTGYNTGPEIFTDYSTHPFENREPQIVRLVPRLVSTAAGRYQLLRRYFDAYKVQLQLPDFSPVSQDLIAIQQIKERRALDLIEEGNIADAVRSCSTVWASFPGNTYGQGGKSLDTLVEKFNII